MPIKIWQLAFPFDKGMPPSFGKRVQSSFDKMTPPPFDKEMGQGSCLKKSAYFLEALLLVLLANWLSSLASSFVFFISFAASTRRAFAFAKLPHLSFFAKRSLSALVFLPCS